MSRTATITPCRTPARPVEVSADLLREAIALGQVWVGREDGFLGPEELDRLLEVCDGHPHLADLGAAVGRLPTDQGGYRLAQWWAEVRNVRG